MSGSPPHNREAEQAVLGALLVADSALPAVRATGLEVDDFYMDRHRVIFTAICELVDAGERADTVSVPARLNGQLDEVGGADYVPTLASTVPAISAVTTYARQVRSTAIAFREFLAASELKDALTDGDDARISRARAALAEASGEVVTGMASVVPNIQMAIELCALPDPPESDLLLGPMVVRGARTVLGAHTGDGKTTLGLQIVRAVTRGEGFLEWEGAGDSRALVIDAEQGLRTIKRRLREAGLDESKQVDYLRVPDGLSLDSNAAHIEAIEKVLEKGQYALVVADPLYKLHRGDSNDERAAVDLMRRLDGWRERFGFALLLLVHCRKPAEPKKFSMHELFGSSAYLRGAEVVLGLQRLSDGYSRLHFFKDREGDLPVGDKWGLIFNRESGFGRDPHDGRPTARDQVDQLLIERPGMTMEEIKSSTDYAERTLRDALKELGAEASGMPKRWALPADQEGFDQP